MAKILLVDDDKGLCDLVERLLVFEHHTVEKAYTGGEAEDKLFVSEYDLIILDWELPELSGLTVCRQYRGRGGRAPVLMLTGRTQVSYKEDGFDAGVDDYVTKPFDLRELSARVKALLRRPATYTGNILRAGDIQLNSNSHEVTKCGTTIQLLPREFALLQFFMRHPNVVYSIDALLERVWEASSEASAGTVRQTIKRLRSKIDSDSDSSIIKTVHGVGYKLESNS